MTCPLKIYAKSLPFVYTPKTPRLLFPALINANSMNFIKFTKNCVLSLVQCHKYSLILHNFPTTLNIL